MRDVSSITENDEGEVITWTDGRVTLIPWDDNPQYEPANFERTPYPEFATFDPDVDMDRLDAWPRYTWGVYHIPHLAGKAPGLLLEPPDYFFHTIDRVKAAVGDTISVHGEVFSPFTHFMELFNYEEALVGLVIDPGTSRRDPGPAGGRDAGLGDGTGGARRGCGADLVGVCGRRVYLRENVQGVRGPLRAQSRGRAARGLSASAGVYAHLRQAE